MTRNDQSTDDTDRTCSRCGRSLNDELPANRPIPVTVGRSALTVCGSCWRSIRPGTDRSGGGGS